MKDSYSVSNSNIFYSSVISNKSNTHSKKNKSNLTTVYTKTKPKESNKSFGKYTYTKTTESQSKSKTKFTFTNKTNLKKTAEDIYCAICLKKVIKSALEYDCKHIICSVCLSKYLLKKGLKPLENLSNTFKFICPLDNCGIAEIPIENLVTIFAVDDKCLLHGEKETCDNCSYLTMQINNLSKCKTHINNDMNIYCFDCNVNCCIECLKVWHQGHRTQSINTNNNTKDNNDTNNFSEFSKKFKNIEEDCMTKLNYEYKYLINKVDSFIETLNLIKNSLQRDLSENKIRMSQICILIKYIYFYCYKIKYNNSTILDNINQLEQISIINQKEINQKLNECHQKLSNLNINLNYKIDINNSYSICKAELLGHEGYIFSLIQIDEAHLVSCSEDKNIIIWNIYNNTKEYIIEKAHMHSIYSLCDLEKEFISGSFSEIKVWSKVDYQILKTIRGHKDYITNLKVLYYNNKQILASCSFDKTVNLWYIDSWNNFLCLKGHNGNVNAIVQLYNNSEEVITCSHDKTIKFWELNQGIETSSLEAHSSPIHSMILLSDGRLVSGSFNDIKIWDMTNKQILYTFNERNMGVFYLLELPGNRLISASFKEINFWDLKEYRWLFDLEGHNNFITSLIILKDGRLVSASDDKTIKIWE